MEDRLLSLVENRDVVGRDTERRVITFFASLRREDSFASGDGVMRLIRSERSVERKQGDGCGVGGRTPSQDVIKGLDCYGSHL